MTNLESRFPTITEDEDTFAIYYPFHKYQFDLLQNFLFSSKALTSTQVAARGMIITTFDVMRKQLKDLHLFEFGAAYHLTTEAQTQPPAALVNKYEQAAKTLISEGTDIDGVRLLKTIHFIKESERANPTIENITKLYLTDLEEYHKLKPQIEEALEALVESKILISSNHESMSTRLPQTRNPSYWRK